MTNSSMSMEDPGSMVASGFGEKEPRWDEKIDWLQFPDDSEAYAYRLVARPVYYAQHWLMTKKRDGTKGKALPVLCKNYDSATSKWAENGCEVCSYINTVMPFLKDVESKNYPEHIRRAFRRTTMATNAIIRKLQEEGPPMNNTGGWSFIRPIRVPQGVSDTLLEKQNKFNKVNGVVYGFNHKEYGKDILLSYNGASKDPNKIYMVEIGDRAALTEEELSHQNFLVNFIEHLKYPSDDRVKQMLNQFGYFEYLDSLVSVKNLKQIQKSSGPAPVQSSVSFSDTEAASPMSPSDPEPDVDMGPAKPVTQAKPAAPAPAPAPVAPAAPAPAPAPAANPAPAPAPVAAAPAPAPVVAPAAMVSASASIEDKIKVFASANNFQLAAHDQEYADLRFFKKGMAVPACFSKYSSQDKKICKQCPLRMDCMMAES